MQNNSVPSLLESYIQKAIFESMQNYLISNAVFLSERLFYENQNEENLSLLCECHLLDNRPYKVYSLLKKSKYLKNKYIFGVACIRLNKFQEAEEAFLHCLNSNYNASYSAYMLGLCYENQLNSQEATEYFRKALFLNQSLWIAYEKLCKLGVFLPVNELFHYENEKEVLKESFNFSNYELLFKEKNYEKPSDLNQILFVKFQRDKEKDNASNSRHSDSGGLFSSNSFTTNFEHRFSLNSHNFHNINNINYEQNYFPITNLKTFLKLFSHPVYHFYKFQIKEALNFLQQLPQKHLNSCWAQTHLGKCYLELRNYQLAETYFKKALELEPYNIECMGYYSIVLWQLKKSIELAYLSRLACEQSLFENWTWIVCANCFSEQKEHETALSFLKRAIQLKSNDSYVYCVFGFEFFYLDDYVSAKKSFETSIVLNKRNYNAWWGLGNIYFKQEKYDKALELFQRAIFINPINSVLYTYMGMAFCMKKIYGEALKYFDFGLSLDEKNHFCRFQKAVTLYDMKQYELALIDLDKLFRNNPKETEIIVLIAKTFSKLGNEVKENYYMNLALELEPYSSQKIKASLGYYENSEYV